MTSSYVQISDERSSGYSACSVANAVCRPSVWQRGHHVKSVSASFHCSAMRCCPAALSYGARINGPASLIKNGSGAPVVANAVAKRW